MSYIPSQTALHASLSLFALNRNGVRPHYHGDEQKARRRKKKEERQRRKRGF